MMWSTIAFLILLSSPLSSAVGTNGLQKSLNGDVAASSPLGTNLLSKARKLENDDDDYYYMTWISGYSLRFEKCHSTIQFRVEGGDENGGSPTEVQQIATFRLCPTESCGSSCSGPLYVVELRDYVDAYVESKMNQQEYNCEITRENCYCDDVDDDEVCEAQCYTNAGYDYCIEDEDEEDDEVDINEYMECREMEVGENNNNNNNNNNGNNNANYEQYQTYYADNYKYQQDEDFSLFVGPYCSSDGKSVYLGVFYDQGCSTQAPSNLFAKYNWGKSLPYQSESIVGSECVSCKEQEENNGDNNNNNDQDADNISEMCEELYERSGKCENNLNEGYHTNDVASCDFINKILPKMENVYKHRNSGGGGGAAVAFTWIFFLTTMGFAGLSFYLYGLLKRKGVDLSAADGTMA